MTNEITYNQVFPNASDNTPTTKEEWLNVGSAYYKAKHYPEAITACEQAIRIDPKYASAYFAKGLALISLNLYDEAIVALQQAAKLNPQNSGIFLAKGSAFYHLKRYEEAGAALLSIDKQFFLILTMPTPM